VFEPAHVQLYVAPIAIKLPGIPPTIPSPVAQKLRGVETGQVVTVEEYNLPLFGPQVALTGISLFAPQPTLVPLGDPLHPHDHQPTSVTAVGVPVVHRPVFGTFT
jgi:hypothetical protein